MDFAEARSTSSTSTTSRFVSVTQQFNTTTSMGRLTLNILLSFAQFEREIIGERIRDKKLATARQGKYIGGQPKLGLDIVDRRYVVNREEAKIVGRMFKMLLELESCRKVAEALNAEGITMKRYRTKTGKEFGGKPWRGRNVYDVLTDRKYIGQIVHKGKAYQGEHGAIVSADLFEKVQAVLSANRTYTHKHQVQRFALLRRMLRCGHCGSLVQPAWTTNHGREYRYYTCSKRIKTGYGKCPLPSLPAGEIETMVVDQVRAILRHPDLVARTYREIRSRAAEGPSQETAARLEKLQRRRDQTQKSIRAVLNLEEQDSTFLAEELKRLNGELKSLERSIRQFNSQQDDEEPIELGCITEALGRIDPIWEVLYPEEQRRVLELLIESITVTKDAVEVRFRTNGIEQVVEELKPIGAATND